MNQLIQSVLDHPEETIVLRQLIDTLAASEKRYFLRNEIMRAFTDYCQQHHRPAHYLHASLLGNLIQYTHELILEDNDIWLLLRPWIGCQQVWRLDPELSECELKPAKAILEVRDRWVNRDQPQILEIDVSPFYENTPSIDDPRKIGEGLAFLNRHLCHQMLSDRDYWLDTLFDVLQSRQYDGKPLLINDQIASAQQLVQQLQKALQYLDQQAPESPYKQVYEELQTLGFEPGWGNTAARIGETMELLEQMFHNPQPAILEAFITRFPAVFRVVSVSIHGWVGQDHVLGRSETLGQVAYVLDQARHLESKLQQDIHLAGLDILGIQPKVVILTRLIPNCEGTQCNLPLEKVEGTDNAWILRVPLREFNPKITDNWVRKSEIWPYLEPFAVDAEQPLVEFLGGTPDLIIGNYSDGNLVAYLLAQKLQVTHCSIAHSLEKPKHLFSNLYWQDLESKYHFAAQFAVDLIGMNAADFIITSSYQEIVGTPDSLGQYESYKHFTMPQLYHVVNGIDLFSPKFNRVPPGIDETFFFPYRQQEQRDPELRQRVEQMLFHQEDSHIRGALNNPELRPILAISPIDAIKNLAGLVECFGQHEALHNRCNLLLVTSKLHVDEAINAEEAEEIRKINDLIEHYNLHDRIRWIGIRLPAADLGEIYRLVADRQGAFVHFARFEAFGRVLLEAMISGLPSFVTEFGGSAEIVEDGKQGFLINPTALDSTARKILEFLDHCEADPEYWKTLSENGIQRIRDGYNWQFHTKQLLLLAKLYSFWNYVHRESREALLRYLEALFHLIYKPHAQTILEEHMKQ